MSQLLSLLKKSSARGGRNSVQSVLGQGKLCGPLLSLPGEPQAVQQQAGLGRGHGGWQGHSSMGQL